MYYRTCLDKTIFYTYQQSQFLLKSYYASKKQMAQKSS
ncbi:hypothetical protein [uncultured Gammaproteobacteria bacterium]|nr:hypothetical protein [uncultured Gammaproteobacteria bacterium]